MITRILPALFFTSMGFASDANLAALEQKLTPIVQKHFPDARIQSADGVFEAKHGTMEFVIHNVSKTGEVSPKTSVDEGPNYRGFMLRVSREKGSYRGAADAPQEIGRIYWKTYFNAVPTEDGGHWLIHFSYGSRLEPTFQKAVMDALPKSGKTPK